MDFYTQITQDFFFMLDLCKHPKEVFSNNSRDYEMANKWLEKLCRMVCTSLNERRWRNVYMSHLLVCMNEGRLKEPFNENPPKGGLVVFPLEEDKRHALKTVDLEKPVKSSEPSLNASDHSLGLSSKTSSTTFFYEACDTSSPNESDNDVTLTSKQVSSSLIILTSSNSKTAQMEAGSPYLTAEMCSDDVSCWGRCNHSLSHNCNSSRPESTTRKDPPMPPPPSPTSEQQYHDCQMIAHTKADDSAKALEAATQACQTKTCPNEHAADSSSLNEDIEELLNAISAELRGDKTAGANAYLEKELVRYKEFMIRFSNMALLLDKTQTLYTMRSFLLLNLQNDLIKLINDIKYHGLKRS